MIADTYVHFLIGSYFISAMASLANGYALMLAKNLFHKPTEKFKLNVSLCCNLVGLG